MMRWLANLIIAAAKRKPYRKGHLYHPDGSLYMARYCFFETRWLSARVHHLATADSDRHFHDHPWAFVSLMLRGAYVEERPRSIFPCFDFTPTPNQLQWEDECGEAYTLTLRKAGSLALRHAPDRHRISVVMPDTWSLFVYGPERQWWGFYTPQGKIYFQDYAKANPDAACVARVGGVLNLGDR